MTTRVAIHQNPGSFSDRWIVFCEKHSIPFQVLDLLSLSEDDLTGLRNFSHIMANFPMGNPSSYLRGFTLLQAAELCGIKTFPSFREYSHFDNKIAQWLIFNTAGLASIPTFISTDKSEALAYTAKCDLPVVFKLAGGASSVNVKKLSTRRALRRAVTRMFGRGVKRNDNAIMVDVVNRIRVRRGKGNWRRLPAQVARIVRTWWSRKAALNWERGYVLLQPFLIGNSWDTRVTVIGHKAFAFRRINRPGDFRASGSGTICYDQRSIDKRCLEMAFAASDKLGCIGMAYDFLINQETDEPLVVEMSYSFSADAVRSCPGYWTKSLRYVEKNLDPEDEIIENFLRS